jgi:hypothetical protein
MSLDWNVTRVKDQNVCWASNDEMTDKCNALIWMTMAVGIPEITEKNYKEFAFRLATIQRLFGVMRLPPGVVMSESEIKQYIGLSTNANQRTLAQFWKANIRTHDEKTRAAMRAAEGAFLGPKTMFNSRRRAKAAR